MIWPGERSSPSDIDESFGYNIDVNNNSNNNNKAVSVGELDNSECSESSNKFAEEAG